MQKLADEVSLTITTWGTRCLKVEDHPALVLQECFGYIFAQNKYDSWMYSDDEKFSFITFDYDLSCWQIPTCLGLLCH